MGNITSIRALAGLTCLALVASCAGTPKNADATIFAAPLKTVRVTSSFGERNGRPHKGIDLRAAKGTRVGASSAGIVTFRGRQRGFGRLIIIRHAGGYETYYAHLSGFKVRKGEKVKAGETIGLVGKSGNASGYHLHFEIRKNGIPMDPAPLAFR